MAITKSFRIRQTVIFSVALVFACSYAIAAGRPALQCSIASPTNPVSISTGESIDYVSSVSGGSSPYRYEWNFQNGAPLTSTQSSQSGVLYQIAGDYTTSLAVTDRRGATCIQSLAVAVRNAVQQYPSINSTSSNSTELPASPVPTRDFLSHPGFQLLGANDLGMHCGDLDHRAVSILPLFNVVHAQVIKRGAQEPEILDDSQVSVEYSAIANPLDPAGKIPVAPGASVFKSNFWDLQGGQPLGALAYGPFYPSGVDLSLFLVSDLGLPVPDAAELPNLVPAQQPMPGINGPYSVNESKTFETFYSNTPFFSGFPFGYQLNERQWFAAEGIPITTFDDYGRTNPYPLMRLQARATDNNTLGVSGGTVVATLDTVVPVSGEADCKNCHTDKNIDSNDIGNGLATNALPSGPNSKAVFGASDDPEFGALPLAVSQEHAADINMLRLHDKKHGTDLELNQPVACQTCHYTPALDLAQVGPTDDNGKSQTQHASMSRVMHDFHGSLCTNESGTEIVACTASNSKPLFQDMPGPLGRSSAIAQETLNNTCYTCHPGKSTKCLRGVMSKEAGSVCQDCHGDMQQVGNDFSGKDSPHYTDLDKRVPWAIEPGCQSCHTGDAVNNLAGETNVIAEPAVNQNGSSISPIRLLQAWRTDDTDAKPIVAANRRFAEEQIDGKEVLYRLSKGHGGVFCEGCHGSTHAEWPAGGNKPDGTNDPDIGVNDNIAATQIQGHEGKIQECDACHQRDPNDPRSLAMPLGLDGPHGMHPVNDNRWNHQHRNFTGGQYANCRTCHGADLTGTALSAASADRVLDKKDGSQATFEKGHMFGCGDCHRQKR